MRRLATVLAATVLVGCQGFNLPITGAGAHYNQLNFTPATESSLNLIGNKGAGQTATPAVAPAAGADVAVGAPVPAPMPYYGGGGYWGSEYELVSTSEAKVAGFTGTYQQTLDSVVKPMVSEWASDAVLRSAGGLTDGTGVNVKPSPAPSTVPSPMPTDPPKPDAAATASPADRPVASMPAVMPVYVQPTGWRFEFASRAKRETLYFYVAADSTLVVKQAYRERTQDLSGAKLNSADVIALVTKAIQDKSITASDPYQQAFVGDVGVPMPAVAVAPAAATAPAPAAGPTATVTPSPTALPETPPQMASDQELTTVPANARWDLNLNLEYLPTQTKSDGTNPSAMPTRLVWNVAMQIDYSSFTPEPGVDFSGAWARVDATTGALLSLSRPHRYAHYVRPGADGAVYPVPPTPPTVNPATPVNGGPATAGAASQ